jgi:hypothetical protein
MLERKTLAAHVDDRYAVPPDRRDTVDEFIRVAVGDLVAPARYLLEAPSESRGAVWRF